ncbi:MAG: helix-turn-helix domain-containing protein [Flavisolibacter sp.]|nr:helix-turn-helix domain-containing protein [Flavisolibacter sp.]
MSTAYNIKEIRQLHNLTQEEFAQALDITRELVNKMEKGKCPISKATKLRVQQFMQERQREDFSHSDVSGDVHFFGTPKTKSTSLPYLQQRREQKKEEVSYTVPLIGIKAQAGYIRGYEQVDYMETLEKYSLPPGVNPMGAVWSYFEVDGDSMEPTFHAGDIILASMLPVEDWKEVKNFCVYIILTNEQLLVKRIYRNNDREWLLISDNEELYSQVLLDVANVKQVWTFRRHIRSQVPQPREFKISA